MLHLLQTVINAREVCDGRSKLRSLLVSAERKYQMLNLYQLVSELREIADQADKQRLSVWVTQFETEFPDLAEEVKYCARMSSPTIVLAYLRERDQRFALLALIPSIEPVIAFLMEFINERSNNDDSDIPVLPVINRARPTASRARRLRSHT